LDWKAREASWTVDHWALTIFSTLDARDNEVERAHKFRRFEGTQKISLQETESLVFKYTDNVSVDPWVKQIVIGKLCLPKRLANTEIVDVEPAQIPFEVLLIHVDFL
jgi:hypothetical protein